MGPQMLPTPKADLAWDHPPLGPNQRKGRGHWEYLTHPRARGRSLQVGPLGKGLLGPEGHDGPASHWASSELGLSPQGLPHPFPPPRSVGPKGKGPPAPALFATITGGRRARKLCSGPSRV